MLRYKWTGRNISLDRKFFAIGPAAEIRVIRNFGNTGGSMPRNFTEDVRAYTRNDNANIGIGLLGNGLLGTAITG